ncbi:flavin reductase [Vibrio sp. JPW-9-11-11]|uniref:flavin reductase family protein n=1 Tax=Vibrio sp. JPW-9-11-11 TaxID=1416532 RepID=UPI001593AC0B|nr:flavin reductase family protein [Vibrio sp. JPW-9-11-11]NVD07708.1 flavin reductase [Vibrio sp. JPW-9-11-11]
MQQQTLNAQQIAQMENRYRARLVNSLSGFKSANLVGTVDAKGQANLAIVSSVTHIGSNPPLLSFISRPNSVERHTLENILETGVFSLNSVEADFASLAHQTSARYPKYQSEFDAVGLTPQYQSGFAAPFVLESNVNIGLNLKEHHTIKANNTEMVIGQVEHIQLPTEIIQADGYLDIESMEWVTVSGLDSYHVTQRLFRLQYAKPDKALRPLSVSGDNSEWPSRVDELC